MAPFSRSVSACLLAATAIRMIGALHDLPGRGRSAPGDTALRRRRAHRVARSCRPSAVLLARRSRGAPFSTPSTSFSHISRVAAGNSDASGRSSVSAGMSASNSGGSGPCSLTEKSHGARAAPIPFAGIASSGELLDSLGGDGFQRFFCSPAADRPIRRNFGQRHQHERRVRTGEGEGGSSRRVSIEQIVVGEQVKVERARSKAPFPRCGRGRARVRSRARRQAGHADQARFRSRCRR